MIPRLFSQGSASFDAPGIGPIVDATSCVVTEEINGAYTLKLTVPRTTPRFSELQVGRIVVIKPNPYDQAQPFRIQRVSKSLRGEIEIYAPHISYDMTRAILWSGSATTLTSLVNALNFVNNLLGNFSFSTTIESPSLFTGTLPIDKPVYAWDLLDDKDETIRGAFIGGGGEWIFDRFDVVLAHRRGAARGYAIEYAQNMTDLSTEDDGENFYSGYLPVYTGSGGLRVGTLVDPILPDYGYSRILLADCTDKFSARPSVASLDQMAHSLYFNGIGQTEISIKVSAVPLNSRGLKTLEELRLGDTITVRHLPLGVDIETRVVQTVFDALRERYTSVDVSNRMIGVATTIARLAKRISRM